ncbi:MAG: hypothetical protein CM15mP46_5630 [Alphaproteobacteria bacterium]|nr:MAG: hypothetical protein CM15mP46_5630 [Alphaproteobacteria bacterium]
MTAKTQKNFGPPIEFVAHWGVPRCLWAIARRFMKRGPMTEGVGIFWEDPKALSGRSPGKKRYFTPHGRGEDPRLYQPHSQSPPPWGWFFGVCNLQRRR